MGRWGVILDAGSSGTRIHVYRWLNTARARQEAKEALKLNRLPQLLTKPEYTKKINPGVSTFADHVFDVGPEHLQSLLDHAMSIVPEDQVKDTPFFLMATAGVRLLEPVKQKVLLDEICSYTKKKSRFSISDCELHIQVIPGETEGLYGWVAANYLLDRFDVPSQHEFSERHHTYGFLDMGGASAQIAFVPNSTETENHANDLKLLRLRTLNGKMSEYKIFTATWLGFGVNQARDRYVASLVDESYTKDASEILDPCLPSGLKTTIDGKPIGEIHQGTELVGTGLFDECLRKINPLLDKNAPCVDESCLLHGQHVPAIDWQVNHFVGVSEYWYTLYEVFEKVIKDERYDFYLYQKLVRDFCSEEWGEIQSTVKRKKLGNKLSIKAAQNFCFKASWLTSVLHDGIGVPRSNPTKTNLDLNKTIEIISSKEETKTTEFFKPINKIKNMEVSWTLGKMVLYAAGQIPPSDPQGLPVGFGPNLGGPESFQEAGSKFDLTTGANQEETWIEAAEELAEKAHSHSTHNFLLILLILVVVGCVIRKRDRRLRFSRMLRLPLRSSSPCRSGRGFFKKSNKFFGSFTSISYDKVLDEEEIAKDFELDETESDDNDNSDTSRRSRTGRTVGRANPRMNIISVDMESLYFDASGSGQADGIGSGGTSTGNTNAFHRAGLSIRTESRERSGLSSSSNKTRQVISSGRRSRTRSPVRGKSPLLSPLGN